MKIDRWISDDVLLGGICGSKSTNLLSSSVGDEDADETSTSSKRTARNIRKKRKLNVDV
jgi:hypothetical protein